jgi:DNA-binding NtrC family response regulator
MQAPGSILVVDDELSVRTSLSGWFRRDGYEVAAAENATAALRLLRERAFDVVLLDIKMPGMDGMDLQEHIHRIDPRIAVVMITAFASVETAVRALKQGAFDYVTKPIDPDELSHLVRRAMEQRRLAQENTQLRQAVDDLSGGDPIVGESPAIRKVMELVQHVAGSEATVLVRGESGTGKELVARAIHAASARRYFPIVPVNCGAVPEGLLESELFGHEKGSFTGAQYRRKGKIEMADGGTLFLDELGETSQSVQVNLLRVLEEMTFRRVGGRETVTVDVRIVAATNVDLETAVDEGRFRQDLFYRLNVFPIILPPLRERREDIPLLMRHFLDEIAEEYGLEPPVISSEAMESVLLYHWPGNVRQLRAMCERWVITRHGQRLEREHLPSDMTGRPQKADEVGGFLIDERTPLETNTKRALAQVERAYLYKVLQRCGGHLERTAEEAGISRRTLYTKMKEYGLEAGDFKPAIG